MKVRFRPSTEEYARVAILRREDKSRRRQSGWITWAFFLLNAIVVPAIFFLKENLLIGLVIFILNVILLFYLLPFQNRQTMKTYYDEMRTGSDDVEAEVELTDEALRWSHNGDHGSCAWRNVRSIGETEASIYFNSQQSVVVALKSGFSSKEDQDAFMSLAKEQLSRGRS